MERKGLGRGLQDISRTFMSRGDESKAQKRPPPFLPVPAREESCSACLNIVEVPFDTPKCRVFSFENENYGVPAMDSIMLGYAKYCRYFEPVSSRGIKKGPNSESDATNEDDMPYDVEETVTSHKRITVQDDENVQKNLKKKLSEHLDEGYEITRIDLEKREEHSGPRHRKKKHEEVTIVQKGSIAFMRTCIVMMLTLIMLLMGGCAAPRLSLFPDETEPLREFTLEGKEKGKVLIISVDGIISDAPERSFLRQKPSKVQEIVSQLRLAEKDKEIGAILLKIDSPGGSTTASDILYHEIMEYKKRTQTKVVVSMMNLATSGAYYISLPADYIMAHPTTVTGSIGVIFVYPRVTGLMKKIGLDVEVNKSGKNKDMASPFREATKEERRIFQGITDDLGEQFLDLVVKHRSLDKEAVDSVTSARVYLSKEALEVGLVDEIGYLSDAIMKSKRLANLSEEAKVIVYRRTEYPDDNVYNTKTLSPEIQKISLVDLNLPESFSDIKTGFYYLWMPSSD